MPHDRFYSPTLESIKGSEFHHLAHVVRVRVGEEVELVDGKGHLATARVDKIGKEEAHLTLLSQQHFPEPSTRIFAGIALLRMNRLEVAIEKGTELGADAFYLFPAERSEKEELSPNQLERLTHLTISALKQSGRLYLPKIRFFHSLKDTFASDALLLFGDTRASARPMKPEEAERILFLTGPESGFSEGEQDLLEEKAEGVKLHENILRAETAPLAALAILSYLYR